MEAVLEVLLIWTPEQLDQNPWLLTCINGTIDLKAGEKMKPKGPYCVTIINGLIIDNKT
jgi:phage/plasmid-associated DNA primase